MKQRVKLVKCQPTWKVAGAAHGGNNNSVTSWWKQQPIQGIGEIQGHQIDVVLTNTGL